MLKRVVLVLLAVLVLVALGAFLLPRQGHVERSVTIAAPRANVFALLNGFRRFNEWSPWAARDPKATYTFAGPRTGVGASMSWTGDPDTIGTGSQKIVESRPEGLIRTEMNLDQGPSTATFTLAPSGTATTVTWALDTDLGLNPIARYMWLLAARWVGSDFEEGLANLKALAEREPMLDVAGLRAEIAEVTSMPLAFVTASSPLEDEAATAAALGAALAQVKLFMTEQGVRQAAPAMVLDVSTDGGQYTFDAGIPIDRLPEQPVAAESAVKLKGTYAGLVAKAVHRGAYDELRRVREQLATWAALNRYAPAGKTWIENISDPASTAQADLVTNVYLPVK